MWRVGLILLFACAVDVPPAREPSAARGPLGALPPPPRRLVFGDGADLVVKRVAFPHTFLGTESTRDVPLVNASGVPMVVELTAFAPFSVEPTRIEMPTHGPATVRVTFRPTGAGDESSALLLQFDGHLRRLPLFGRGRAQPVCAALDACSTRAFDPAAAACVEVARSADGTPCDGGTCVGGRCDAPPACSRDADCPAVDPVARRSAAGDAAPTTCSRMVRRAASPIAPSRRPAAPACASSSRRRKAPRVPRPRARRKAAVWRVPASVLPRASSH